MAEETEEMVEEESEFGRSQMEKHEAFVEWYASEFGENIEEFSAAEVIAAFAAKRNAFRKSDGYVELWGPEARAARKAEREAAKAERAAAKKAKDAEAAKEAKAAPAKKATKSTAKKTTKASGGKRAASSKAEDEAFA